MKCGVQKPHKKRGVFRKAKMSRIFQFKTMKKLSFLFLIFIANATFAQTDAKVTHPKVKEYSLLVNDYMTYKKSGKNEPFKDLLKMSTVADEINCLLTIEQAKIAMPFFVENNMRARSCGSADYPKTAVLNSKSVNEYKASIDKMTKQ